MDKIIALENLDFIWDKAETKEVRKMFEAGASLEELCDYTKRRSEEVFLLLLHMFMLYKPKRKITLDFYKFEMGNDDETN